MRIKLTYLEIETGSFCNRKCPWCLFGQHTDFRAGTIDYLDIGYLEKVFHELKENNFKGVISFHSMNEPLLDDRIADGSIFKCCKSILGNEAVLKITTNGDLLNDNVETMFRLGMDYLYVSCYSEEVLHHAADLQKLYSKISILDLTNQNSAKLIFNRAGSIRSQYAGENKKSCTLPLYSAVIGFDGEVRLCCNDAIGQIKFGNIKTQMLYDILNSENMKKLRNDICLSRGTVFPCNICNFDDKCDRDLNPIEFTRKLKCEPKG